MLYTLTPIHRAPRRVVLALFWLELAAASLNLIGQLTRTDYPVPFASGVAVLVICGLLLAYWRGWEPARQLNVAALTVIIGLALPDYFLTTQPALIVLVPPALALVMAQTNWVWGSMLALMLILVARNGGSTIYTNDLRTVATLLFVTGSMVLARLLADGARSALEEQARRAQAEQARAEQQAHELSLQSKVLSERNIEQERLLALVATLETPAITVGDGVLLAPLVGRLDSRRAEALMGRLLRMVSEQRIRLVVIDLTGVPEVDGAAAQAIERLAQAIQLLGSRVTISGISPAAALILSRLDVQLTQVSTVRTPQDALQAYALLERSQAPRNGPQAQGGRR